MPAVLPDMLPRVSKPARVRDLGPVEVSRLIGMVGRISPETWLQEDAHKENDFEVFHHTRHIIFRFIAGNRDPRDSYANPAWDAWQVLLQPIMDAAIAPYGFAEPRFPKAMLARLAAGHAIDPHYDGAGSNLLTHKIHVPLVTNPAAMFTVDGEDFHLPVGRAYEVNNIKAHGARNLGTEDRVHFIFEVFDAAASSSGAEAVDALL